MKRKSILVTVLITVIGVIVILFVYKSLVDKSEKTPVNRESRTIGGTVPLVMPSSNEQEGPVDFTYAAEQTVQAVVHVRIRSGVAGGDEYDNPLYEYFYGKNRRPQPRKVTGFGSGVIISPDGYVITNNHVVEDADSIQVTLNNNKTYSATLVGRDPDTDIALLKINGENLPVIRYGDSDKLRLGEWVLAVGNPFNLGTTVTAGIVSAKGRSLNFEGNYRIESYIQTDAALNMGNSGGALVNTKAELVGITAAIVSPTGTYSGNSFAIPVNIVKKITGDLHQFGKVRRALIGVKIQEVTSDIAKNENLNNASGAYVASVDPGSAAEEGGIKAKDIIVKINGANVASPSGLQEIISQHSPGDKINITYLRSGKENTVSVVLKNFEKSTSVVRESSGEVVLGSKLIPLTRREKRKYGIDFGVKVTDLGEGKLKEAGIKKGTIILKVNGKGVSNAAEIRDITSDGENFTSIEGILSDGTFFNYQLKS